MRTGNTVVGRIERAAMSAIGAFYAVGLIAHLIPSTRPLLMGLTPYVLLIGGAAVIAGAASASRGSMWQLVVWCVLVVLFTFGAEAVGVATGMVFGRYSYGEVLGTKILGVPPVIGFNWALVVLGSVMLADRFLEALFLRRGERGRVRLIAVTAVAGLISALFDLAMEPSAVALGYWSWEGGTIPFRNYVAWFVLSSLAALGYRVLRIRSSSPLPIAYLLLQLLFFVGLDVAMPRHTI